MCELSILVQTCAWILKENGHSRGRKKCHDHTVWSLILYKKSNHQTAKPLQYKTQLCLQTKWVKMRLIIGKTGRYPYVNQLYISNKLSYITSSISFIPLLFGFLLFAEIKTTYWFRLRFILTVILHFYFVITKVQQIMKLNMLYLFTLEYATDKTLRPCLTVLNNETELCGLLPAYRWHLTCFHMYYVQPMKGQTDIN